jgi:hypothetical protein
MIDDIQIHGAIKIDVEQTSYFRAGHFCITFGVGESPLWNIASFAALSLQVLTVEIATSAFGYINIMTGQIDNIVIDCAIQTATVSGRDLSARLIDTEISESFINQTASQIASTLASRHGLIADIHPSTAIVGQYYELDHARSSLQVHSRAGNEWDLLVWLAESEGNFVSVSGNTLFFGPLPVMEPTLISTENCIELSIDIAMTIPRSVTVKSWNTRNKVALSQLVGSGSYATTLVKPNLSATQAQDLASSHLAALSQHTKMLNLKMPGDVILMPSMPIAIVGTQSSLDQIYMIDQIRREIDVERGFLQSVRAFAVN